MLVHVPKGLNRLNSPLGGMLSYLRFEADGLIARIKFLILQYLAYEYARRGACLTIAARREKSLREVAERALDLGSPDVLVVPADVSKVEDCKRIVDKTMSHFGRCEIQFVLYILVLSY